MATKAQTAAALAPAFIRAAKRGATVKEIAAEYDIRPTTVSAVMRDSGYGESHPSWDRRQERRDEVLQWVDDNPGRSVGDIAKEFKLSRSTVSTYLAGTPQEKLLVMRQKSISRYTKADIKRAIRRVSDEEMTADERKAGLSRLQYDRLRQSGDPSSSLAVNVFGSWTTACKTSRVRPGRTLRKSYSVKYTDDDCFKAARSYIKDALRKGETPTYNGLAAWAAERSGMPSAPAIRKRLGRWSDIRREIMMESRAA